MSENIIIPFRETFRDKMLNGQKTATSRTRKYGNPSDLFSVFGTSFQLTKVTRLPLGVIAYWHYLEEGFDEPQGFVDIWNQIHPNKRFDYETAVWFHEFKRAGD